MTLARWLVSLFAVCFHCACTVSPAFAQAEIAVAYAGFLAGDADRTRLSLDFDRKVSARLRFSAEPKRLVVELPPSVFRLGEPLDAEKSVLAGAISFDQSDRTVSRVVVDLDAPIKVSYQSVRRIGSSERRRLVVDFARASESGFKRLAARSPVATPRAPKVAADQGPAEKPLILLDPGHGGIDGGATGRGRTSEKEVTLDFAKTLRASLLDTKRFRVALTREADTFVSLRRRVEMARSKKAALLISIHADSLRQRRIRGATVYTLSETASDEVARQLATDQNRTDLRANLAAPKLDTGAADILLDLLQRETGETSIQIAQRLVKRLGRATRLIGNPNRSADFFVLRSPDVPSVLLELGYLSNRADEKLLASPEWQAKVATALTAGLIEHFGGARVAAER